VIAQTNIETSQRRKPRLLLWIVCGIILIGITALIAQNINSSKENSSNSGISSENTTANSNRVKPLIIEDEITPTGEVSKPSQANSNVGLNNRPKVSIPPIINGNADPIVHGDPRSKSTETPNASNKSEGKIVSGEAPDPNKVYMPSEVTQKARILSRPEPQYTEEARKNQVSGTVVLRIVLSSSGQVTNISAISGLPYGLTERAIAAARQLRFSPAMKDGHPISQYAQIEYNFNLY
jgi:TonB family protein